MRAARPQFDAVMQRALQELEAYGIELVDKVDDEDWFDVARGLDPEAWLALDETTRQELLLWYHQVIGDAEDMDESQLNLHVLTHLMVENQLAVDTPPSCRRALARLVGEGLSRHDAVHAIGLVLARHLFEVLHDHKPPDADRYARDLDALDRATWEESAQAT